MARQMQIPVWSWRDAVRHTDCPPSTKLLCYTIAFYLTDAGDYCYPSIATLMAESGLKDRAITNHLAKAVEYGLLEIERETGKDGRKLGNVYMPRFPDNMTLPKSGTRKSNRARANRAPQRKEQIENRPSANIADGDDHPQNMRMDRPPAKYADGPSAYSAENHPQNMRIKRSSPERKFSTTPQSPPGGEVWGGVVNSEIMDLQENETLGHILPNFVHLVAPILKPPKDVDPGSYLRLLAKALAKYQISELEALADEVLLKSKYRLPAVPDLLAQIEEIRANAGSAQPMAHHHQYGTPQWDAWRAYHAKRGNDRERRWVTPKPGQSDNSTPAVTHGIPAPSEWPPGYEPPTSPADAQNAQQATSVTKTIQTGADGAVSPGNGQSKAKKAKSTAKTKPKKETA